MIALVSINDGAYIYATAFATKAAVSTLSLARRKFQPEEVPRKSQFGRCLDLYGEYRLVVTLHSQMITIQRRIDSLLLFSRETTIVYISMGA